MGLGGHLLWSSVIRTLNQTSGQPVLTGHLPQLSDMLSGHIFDRGRSLEDDEIFRHNPRITFPAAARKSGAQRTLDRIFRSVLHRTRLHGAYERLVFRIARARTRRGGLFHVHIDMQLHSYAKNVSRERMEWRKGGHIIDILAGDFGVRAIDHVCELYFTRSELASFADDARLFGLDADYVVVEPNSREAWFGDLRAWPFERWQALVDVIRTRLGYQVVQVGDAGGRLLSGVVSLVGKLPFRRSALVMKHAKLFVGQEGGLNHAANAVGVPSVMIWGGLTLPEFAAYPKRHTIVCARVECAPCGLRGGCPYNKKCLTSIEVDEVVGAVRGVLHVAAPVPLNSL